MPLVQCVVILMQQRRGEQCINISNELKKKFSSLVILINYINTVSADGGGDDPEDWVGAYQIALDKMNWRDGVRLIIHIADAPAHGHSYCGYDNHEEENSKLAPLLKRCGSNGIKIVGMPIDEYCCRKSYEKTKIDYDSASNPDKFYRIQPFKSE